MITTDFSRYVHWLSVSQMSACECVYVYEKAMVVTQQLFDTV